MNHRDRMSVAGALAVAGCLVLLLPNPVSAETYQWTDKDGNVGFADSLEKVPPKFRSSAKRLEEKESKEPTKRFQRVPSAPGQNYTMPPAPSDQGAPYAAWRGRLEAARAELEELRAKRQKAQEEYDNLLYLRHMRSRNLDPETEAQAASKISELDKQVRAKEYEVNTAIPDEARRAGVPPGMLSQ